MFSFKNASEEVALRARNTFGSTSPESEIGVGLKADLSYKISSSRSLQLNLSRNIVYTDTKLKLNYAGVGIVRSFRVPDWLREVLK